MFIKLNDPKVEKNARFVLEKIAEAKKGDNVVILADGESYENAYLFAAEAKKLGINAFIADVGVHSGNSYSDAPIMEPLRQAILHADITFMTTPQMQTNFASSLRLIQLCAPKMKEKGWGRVLTVGSVQQYKPHKDMLVYAASKAAQMNMVQNLAKQLAPFGITVNNLAPGVIATPRNDAALADPDYAPKVLSGIPMGYAGESQDCAGAALLLCSDEGRYITGIDLVVDGGMKL